MDIKLEARRIADVEADAVIVIGFQGAGPAAPAGGQIQELYDSGEFTGKALEIAVLHRPAGMKAKRLAIAGGGERGKLDSSELRKVSGAAVRSLKSKGARSIALALDEPFRSDDFAAAAVEGAMLGDFENDRYKTDPAKKEKHLDSFAVLGGSQSAMDRGRVLAEAQNFSRSLADEPANVLTPTGLAERARQMAAEQGLDCEVLDRARLRQLRLCALLGGAQGSTLRPALIVLRYQPPAAPPSKDPLVLVRKSATFDTA